jgi:phage shock protein E
LKELGPPDRPIVLYCASGARSAHAKRVLARHGFAAVRNLGSIRAW